ncbi:MAG TPA: polysaccharide biosynthesis tyrosine autokinase [Acidobacteriaceae bacterium]|nr:polysaccharide biosynthesis tyrosine autokinase [Acidobacteriaceae bacterium]
MQGRTNPPQGAQPEVPASGSSTHAEVFTPADLRKVILKRKWLILAATLVGIGIAVLLIVLTIPEYESFARVNINLGRSTNIGVQSFIQQNTSYFEDPDTELQTQLQIMRSQTVAMDVINTLDLYHKKPFSKVFAKHPYSGHLTPVQRAVVVGIFQGSTRINVVPGTDLVDVHFTSPEPAVAMQAANAIVDAYMQRDLQARFKGTTRISDWLAQQLTGLKKQVDANQQVLARYVQKHNIVATDSQGGSLVTDSLSTVNQQLAQAQADRIVKEARYKMALTRNPELLVSVAPGTILGSLRAQQADLMVQEAQLRSKFGPEYPRVIEVNKQLASVQADIDTEINNLTKRFAEEYHTAIKTESLLQARLDVLKQQAYRENAAGAQFDILKHAAESAAELYNALQLRLQEAGITAGLSSNDVDVIDRATIPTGPILPRKRSDLIFGLLGGLGTGFVLAFALEMFDDRLESSDEVEGIVQLPTLAVVPHFSVHKNTVQSSGRARTLPDLISYLDPHSLGAEAFRTLRSSILLTAIDRKPKLLLVVSSFAEEGKSTIASNLAVSFAQREEKVLLVDTDLRRGTTHLKFGLSNNNGLSSVLARGSGENAYEKPLPELPGLTVLSRGPIPPNPGEMLASHAMEAAIERWRTEFDRIIFDSSPVLAVSDALSLAPQADGVLILVRAGMTRKRALLKTCELLRRVNGRILGTVINDADLRLENYYTYSKRYGYDYTSNYGAGYGVSDDKS